MGALPKGARTRGPGVTSPATWAGLGLAASRPELRMLDGKPPLLRLAFLGVGAILALLVTAAAAARSSPPSRADAAAPRPAATAQPGPNQATGPAAPAPSTGSGGR